MPVKMIKRFLRTFADLNIYSRYDTRLQNGLVFGRASSPLKLSARFFTFWFGKHNYNNILLHAKSISNSTGVKIADSGTFNFTRFLEKKLILKIADILKLSFLSVSGYVTTGGTEANIYAMWIAREWAKSKIKGSKNKKIYWIIPNNAHCSVRKAMQLLNIDNSNIINIKTDALGCADYNEIVKQIKKIKAKSNSPIILPLTVMTTECGAIDPVKRVDEYIIASKLDNIFFHVDAAFSGLFLPFIEEYKDIFNLKSLQSIAVDFNKAVGGPVGSGAIIFRPGLEEHINVSAPYLLGDVDQTLVGSRKGSDVIATYSLLSIEDSKKDVLDAIAKAKFLAEEMASLSYIKLFYEPSLSYIVFSLVNLGKQKEESIRKVLNSYSISSSIVKIENKDQELFKIILRSDHKYKNITKFINELKVFS